MKKIIFCIIPLTILVLCAWAPAVDDVQTVVIYASYPNNVEYPYYRIMAFNSDVTLDVESSNYAVLNGTYVGLSQPRATFQDIQDARDYLDEVQYWGGQSFRDIEHMGNPFTVYVIKGHVTNNVGSIATVFNPIDPTPPEPEPGDTWFDDMWTWAMEILGISDEFSSELKEWILEDSPSGGGHSAGHSFEIITPTPSPTPSPFPSPTPYDLTINYSDGSSGTITGIPGSTTIINGGDTTNNYGSDFDIFDVDYQLRPSGGLVNPRDGLNSVMDTSLNYLSDPENVDLQAVSDSFSIIPNDWFLLLGVVSCFPFIAGFISKLLK